MKGVDWGALYSEFKDQELDTDALEKRVAKLMLDDDVEKKSGIYPYVLTGDQRHLNIRAFSENMRREAYDDQGWSCSLIRNDCYKRCEEGSEQEEHTSYN